MGLGTVLGLIEALATKVRKQSNEIHGLVSTGERPKIETTDLLDLTWNEGYVTNGSISSSDSYRYTTIPVQKGDIIQPYVGGADFTIRFADLMNGSTVVSALTYQHPLNVPDGVDSVVISIAKSFVIKESFVVKKTRRTTETVEIGRVPAVEDHVISDEENSIRFTFNLEANSVFSDPLNRALSDGCGYNIAFNAKISSALTGQVVVGKGYGNDNGAAVGVDATNIYIYENGAAIGSPSYTQAHGLTLKDYICIEVDAEYSITTCKVRLKTNGGEYSYTPTRWRSQNGIMSVRSTLDALTDCMLSYACPALDNDIWIYGDSYLGWYNDNRWAYWLVNAGHTKYLLNSFPGRSSIAAYDSFLTDISMNKLPKKIIWCMGMNDKDNADTPNENWKFAVDSLMEFCEDKKIELILSTIPNVTADTTKNTLKNAYVVESGYRFIDFAKAVSADGSTTWYDNMLHTDNVHPTKEGAKALYAAAVATVPELLKF